MLLVYSFYNKTKEQNQFVRLSVPIHNYSFQFHFSKPNDETLPTHNPCKPFMIKTFTIFQWNILFLNENSSNLEWTSLIGLSGNDSLYVPINTCFKRDRLKLLINYGVWCLCHFVTVKETLFILG